MSDRRRTLLIGVFGVMVVMTVGDYAFRNYYEQPLEAAVQRKDRLTEEIAEKRAELKQLAKRQHRLDLLKEASLPAEAETARTQYLGWLNELAQYVDLLGRQVDSNPPRSYEGYRILPFSLRGRVTLEQLTTLLYQFYEAPYLHHIRTITVTPVAGTRLLSLNLAVEAISLDGGVAETTLPEGKSDQLASDRLADYRVIAQRNVFSASGGVQAERFTTLTAIVESDGYRQAWFNNALDDEIYRLSEGDALRVGAVRGQIERITVKDVILSVGEDRWLLTIDDRLTDATALPPER